MTLGISDNGNNSRIPFDPIHTNYLFHTIVPRSSPPLRVTAFDNVCRPLALAPVQPYSSLDIIAKVRKADDPPGPGKGTWLSANVHNERGDYDGSREGMGTALVPVLEKSPLTLFSVR